MSNIQNDSKTIKIPEFALTSGAETIFLATRYAHINRDISLIYGEAGLGKSHALQNYAKNHDKVLYIEARNCDRSTKGICERILKALGKNSSGTDRVLVDSIIESLRVSNKLLIIDEAQHLSIKAIENIRAINDIAKTGIVLCGNPTIYDRMHGRGQAHFAQLFSRLGVKRKILEPTKEDIKKIFKGSNIDNDCVNFLHSMALSWGGLRNSVKIFNIAVDIATSSNQPLALPHFETALQLKNGEE